MQNAVIEIAVFTVKPGQEAQIPEIRLGVVEALKTLPGFIDYQGCEPTEGSRHFADIVTWDSLDNAHSAAKVLEAGDPRFLPYMQAIDEVAFMGHVKKVTASKNKT